jgi:hypothetical protein
VSEIRAFLFVLLGGIAAVVAVRFALPPLGATDEQIAAAWGVCLAVIAVVGGLVASHYTSPPDRR